MYKLLMVDDEEEVRRGIIEEIDWKTYGFKMVGEAENGMEALNMIDEVLPDVVITDIKMPSMDGLKLSEAIKKKNPTIKIIILTGFDQFEFAQKAVKLHIDEYLLKPVEAKEMINILQKVKLELDDEYAQKEDINLLREHYKKSLPVMKERFLNSIVTGNITKKQYEVKASKFNINLHGNGFVAAIVSIESNKPKVKDKQEDIIEHAAPFENNEYKIIAIINIINEVLNKYGHGLSFVKEESIVILIHSNAIEENAVMSRALIYLEEIRQNIEKYLSIQVTIGVGTVCKDVCDIHFSYQDAVLAIDYKIILGQNKIICIEDLEDRKPYRLDIDVNKQQQLIRCIKVGNRRDVEKIIESIFSELQTGNTAYIEYQIYLLDILTILLKVMKDTKIDMKSIFDSDYNIIGVIQGFNNISEGREWFKKICLKVMEAISDIRTNSFNNLVEQAKEYILVHYAEIDLCVQQISDYLHLSTGYFSGLFKRETGTTCLNYIISTRISNAKRLLESTDMMIYQIAEAVGFGEPYYFSFCFKKKTGLSPRQYRKNFFTDNK